MTIDEFVPIANPGQVMDAIPLHEEFQESGEFLKVFRTQFETGARKSVTNTRGKTLFH